MKCGSSTTCGTFLKNKRPGKRNRVCDGDGDSDDDHDNDNDENDDDDEDDGEEKPLMRLSVSPQAIRLCSNESTRREDNAGNASRFATSSRVSRRRYFRLAESKPRSGGRGIRRAQGMGLMLKISLTRYAQIDRARRWNCYWLAEGLAHCFQS